MMWIGVVLICAEALGGCVVMDNDRDGKSYSTQEACIVMNTTHKNMMIRRHDVPAGEYSYYIDCGQQWMIAPLYGNANRWLEAQ